MTKRLTSKRSHTRPSRHYSSGRAKDAYKGCASCKHACHKSEEGNKVKTKTGLICY